MKYIQKAKKMVIALSVSLLLFTSIPTFAFSPTYNTSTFFDNGDFYNLPPLFNGKSREQSIGIIQKILERDNGKLSTLRVTIADGDANFVKNTPGLAANIGKNVSVAELIWMMSQEDLRIGSWRSMPIDERLNPLFVLAVIQKESGLVYGECSKTNCYGQSVDYRVDRATGYGCPDGSDCYDWALGFFPQVYYGMRWYKAYTKFCQAGFLNGNNELFKTGNTVKVIQGSVTLGSDIVCATYYYTPHTLDSKGYDAQKSFYLTYRNIFDMANSIAGQIATSSPAAPVITIPAPVVVESPVNTPTAPSATNISVSINNITTSDPAPTLSGKIVGEYDQLKLQFGNESEISISPGSNGDWSYKIKYPKAPGTYDIKIIAIKNGVRYVDTTTNEVTIERAAAAPVVNNLAEFVPAPKRGGELAKQDNKKEAVPVLINPEVIENAPKALVSQNGNMQVSNSGEEASILENKKEVTKIPNPLLNIFNQSRVKKEKQIDESKLSLIESEVMEARNQKTAKTVLASSFILVVGIMILKRVKK